MGTWVPYLRDGRSFSSSWTVGEPVSCSISDEMNDVRQVQPLVLEVQDLDGKCTINSVY